MRTFETFEFNNNEKKSENPENNEKLENLRKKQIDCVSMPDQLEDEFLKLKSMEASNEISEKDSDFLKKMRNKYWTKEDQEEFLKLTNGKDLESDSHKRFLELSKKQTNEELTEEEREEIKELYQKM